MVDAARVAVKRAAGDPDGQRSGCSLAVMKIYVATTKIITQ